MHHVLIKMRELDIKKETKKTLKNTMLDSTLTLI